MVCVVQRNVLVVRLILTWKSSILLIALKQVWTCKSVWFFVDIRCETLYVQNYETRTSAEDASENTIGRFQGVIIWLFNITTHSTAPPPQTARNPTPNVRNRPPRAGYRVRKATPSHHTPAPKRAGKLSSIGTSRNFLSREHPYSSKNVICGSENALQEPIHEIRHARRSPK